MKKGILKNLWMDLWGEEGRGVRIFLFSIIAIIIMKLLDFVFSDITTFMLLGWLIYAITRIEGLKQEKEKLKTELLNLNKSSKYLEGEMKTKKK
jgi:hypothetical protein